MKRHTVILLILTLASSLNIAASSADSLLRELDRVIAHKDEYAAGRRRMIDESQANLARVTDDRDLYNIYRSLYSHYRAYSGDSARWVAGRRLDVARRLGDRSRILSSHLNLAESYSLAGDYYQALEILDSLPRDQMESYHLRYLYTVYGITYDRMAKADGIRSNSIAYERKEAAYLDSTLNLSDDSQPDYYYLYASHLAQAGHSADALKVLDAAARNSGYEPTSADLTLRASICRSLHDTQAEIEALAQAAIIDLRNGVRDYSALPALALLLSDRGDASRAYQYIRCALDDAYLCNAKSRTHEILELIPAIDTSYHEIELQRIRTQWILVAVITLLAIVLGLCLLYARRKIKLVHEYSARLNRSNAELQHSNRLLEESNREKVRFITEVFDAHSEYISQTEKFRSRILNLLAARQYKKIADLVESESGESAELKALYARFDTIFLRLYPGFLAEYNSIVRDDCKVDPDAGALTSELRVLALMKIGIRRSSRIAELLHYTPQTVYNYKSVIKNSMRLSKEQYDEYLASTLS